MGKSEGAIGGKPKAPKVRNEAKKLAAAARSSRAKGPVSDAPQYDERGEFGDYGYMSKDYRTLPTILGDVLKQKREICWAISLARLLQAIFNLNISDIAHFLEFSPDDLVKHLKGKELADKLTSLELANIKKAIAYIATKGLLTVKSSKGGKSGDSGRHETWQFEMEENVSAESIRQKLDVSPVVLAFHVSHEFQTLQKEICKIKIEKGKQPSSHMVLVVGYGYTQDGKLFFLVQNSWGKEWGVNGFGRIFLEENSGVTMVYPHPHA